MRIAFMGDVMLGRLVDERLRTAAPASVWGDTLPVLAGADLRIANLECVLARGGTPWPGKVFHFRSAPQNVACLTAAGIDAVSLANNHTLDYGPEALLESVAALDAAGIRHAGAGADDDAAWSPAVVRAGGLDVGLVAFTDNTPDWAAAPRSPGVAYAPVDAAHPLGRRLREVVRATRPAVDVLIVSAHWGGNWGAEVPAEHRALAHALVEDGADLVFGHSPHIVRGIEVHRGRPVIYGAGDFIDDYAVDPVERNDQSFIFMLDLGGSARDGGAGPRLLLWPTLIVDRRAVLAGRAARPIAARMERLCAALGTRAVWEPGEGRLLVEL
ncbi:poly-gamma-glutamate synthesis protein (capsule biosynthesis protein) [Sinomonas atrocyanea]|uniref:CapA family protein n=1 Tax=Sinomonas atrocyanea TaxID=37927 RepID=UPI002785415F|nr:CapA family protein [Sinomonas atrocyanea]MDP9884579.1 poly-gamma-glutamate synthesis protein (capsule biosynthesis protein) [Sinomonas atrocyanea]